MLAVGAIRAIALCVVDAPTGVCPVVAFSDGSEFISVVDGAWSTAANAKRIARLRSI